MKPHAVGVNHGKEQIMKMIKIKAVCYDDLITSDGGSYFTEYESEIKKTRSALICGA